MPGACRRPCGDGLVRANRPSRRTVPPMPGCAALVRHAQAWRRRRGESSRRRCYDVGRRDGAGAPLILGHRRRSRPDCSTRSGHRAAAEGADGGPYPLQASASTAPPGCVFVLLLSKIMAPRTRHYDRHRSGCGGNFPISARRWAHPGRLFALAWRLPCSAEVMEENPGTRSLSMICGRRLTEAAKRRHGRYRAGRDDALLGACPVEVAAL